MSAKFPRFMVDVNVGTNRKLRRLTPAERWCHVAGVLAIAAQATVRGCLLIGSADPEPHDYAEQAGVPLAVVTSTLDKLRELGIIEDDPENGCERVHDWDDFNPPPKNDPTAAERAQRYRRNRAERDRHTVTHRDVTGVTAAGLVTITGGREGKGKEESPPDPPQAGGSEICPDRPLGGRAREQAAYRLDLERFADAHFPGKPADLVAHCASKLRRSSVVPSADNLRELVAVDGIARALHTPEEVAS